MTISEALQKLETLQKQLSAYGHAMSILYIDAVTAATISSRAVIDAIRRAYDAYTTFSAGI